MIKKPWGQGSCTLHAGVYSYSVVVNAHHMRSLNLDEGTESPLEAVAWHVRIFGDLINFSSCVGPDGLEPTLFEAFCDDPSHVQNVVEDNVWSGHGAERASAPARPIPSISNSPSMKLRCRFRKGPLLRICRGHSRIPGLILAWCRSHKPPRRAVVTMTQRSITIRRPTTKSNVTLPLRLGNKAYLRLQHCLA
jgi:hypothetical protein